MREKRDFSGCGPKIDDGDGGGVQNKVHRKNNQNIESYPAEAWGSYDFTGYNCGEVTQELYINHH